MHVRKETQKQWCFNSYHPYIYEAKAEQSVGSREIRIYLQYQVKYIQCVLCLCVVLSFLLNQ